MQHMIVEYGKSASDRTTADMAVLKTTCIDAVKKDPGLTVAGYREAPGTSTSPSKHPRAGFATVY